MRRGDRTPSDLDRPEGNSLVENYEAHDKGEQWVEAQIAPLESVVLESWGIDMRHDSGDDGIIYDDKTDYRVRDTATGDVVALLDVKTKRSARYMGRFNERHYDKYVDQAMERDVPCYVVFVQLDGNRIHDAFAADVVEATVQTTSIDGLRTFPDGNRAAEIDPRDRHAVPWMVDELAGEE